MGCCCPKSSADESVGFARSASSEQAQEGSRPNREMLAAAAEKRAKEQESRGIKHEVRLPKSRDADLPVGETGGLRWQVG